MRSRIAVLAVLLMGLAATTPASAAVWPGSGSVSLADDANVFGSNLSGLAYHPTGTGAKGVLWAVRNSPSTLYRLVHDGAKWTPDTSNGWTNGKQLLFTDGTGVPDAEGVTLTSDDANAVFVAVERNDTGGQGGISRPGVLRYEVSGAGATLTATHDWTLAAELVGLGANAGPEAVTWIPDSVLVAQGFHDEAAGATYDPADYPNHGAGLFFLGIEQTGEIAAFALDQTNGAAFTKVATIPSGFGKVMGLEFEAATNRLWAACDDTCAGQVKTLEIAQSGPSDGRFGVTATYDRPTDMPDVNNEGFAITGTDECVGGVRPVYWADDDNTGGHAIRAGSLNCPAPPSTPEPPGGTPAAPSAPAPVIARGPSPLLPALPRDVTKPKVTGLGATRSSVTLTLSEAAQLTVTVEKRSGRTFKRLKSWKVRGKRGKQTVKFKGKVSAAQTRRGKLRITVVATDAAGNRSVVARKTIG